MVSAIGAQTRLTTLDRAGGTLEAKFRTLGKTAEFKKVANVQIPKYTGVYSYKYAKNIK